MENTLLADFLGFDVYNINNPNDNIDIIYNNDISNTIIFIKSSDKDHLDFLTKILGAIQFDITKDIVLIEKLNTEKISLINIIKKYNINKIILFNIPQKDLGLSFQLPNYRPLKVNNSTFLLADSLNQISKNKVKKKELWTALQQMFL